MIITIVSAVYPPESIVSAYTSKMLATALVQEGHLVNVITAFPNRPHGALYQGFKRRLVKAQQKSANLNIIRCFSFYSNSSTLFSRFLENISYGVVSGIVLIISKKPDVVYANTWPLFSQGIVALICIMRNIRLVFSIQDIYPESLLVQNRLRKASLLFRALKFLDKTIVSSANALVVISERFAEIYHESRGIPIEKINIVPNFLPETKPEDLTNKTYRPSLNIRQKKFVFVYGGNIGAAAGLENIIDIFKDFGGKCDLVIAGSGSHLESCLQLAKGYEHIHIISPWPEEETQQLLSTGNVALLPTAGKQSLASVPSKLITYMLAAKPILAIAVPESDIAQIIYKSGCGWVVHPGDDRTLNEIISEVVKTSKDKLHFMGLEGRAYALAHFTEEVCLPNLVNVIKEASYG